MTGMQRAASSTALIAAAGGLAFTLGVLAVGAWADALSVPIVLTVIAVAVGAMLRLTLGTLRSLPTCVVVGALLYPALLALFVLGIFAPYLGGWGGHYLEEFGGNDADWDSWLTFLLVAAGISGAVFGAFVGLVAWLVRVVRR
ncbi:MAG: hypothetical protein HYS09_05895 [Chloroflexi bacterium]|nr:hypothetical protein [Chloroflexota bacterium]